MSRINLMRNNSFPSKFLRNTNKFCFTSCRRSFYYNAYQPHIIAASFSSSPFSLDKKNYILKKFFNKESIRALHLHEYQSKDLLRSFDLNVQKGKECEDAEKAKLVAAQLKDEGAKEIIIKCQVLAGGRGKGYLSSGLKGGVQICKNAEEVYNYAKQMLNHKIYTHQTTEEGELVKKVLIHEGVDILKELYIAIVLDRNVNLPVFIVSQMGGMDIEDVAKNNEDKVKCIHINIMKGLDENTINDVVEFLDVYNFNNNHNNIAFGGNEGGAGGIGEEKKKYIYEKEEEEKRQKLKIELAEQIKKMYKLFCKYDCTQLEINPLAITQYKNTNTNRDEYKTVCVDAKLQFDDNASFRHKDLFELEDKSSQNARELMAERAGLNFVSMDGNIGCLVNGAGLAMATMDIIKLHGGNPSNFLDVGGGADLNQVTQAFQILQSDSQVRGILVNIFGGIMRCDTVATGVVEAAKKTKLNVPLVVRLCGNKVDEGREILEKSGLKCFVIDDFDEAAKKVCSFVKDT